MKPHLYKYIGKWWCRSNRNKEKYCMWTKLADSPEQAYADFKFYAGYYNAPFREELK